MPNLTTDFSSIVTKVEQSHKIAAVEPSSHATPINDTFITECVDLFVNINKVRRTLEALRPEYLLAESLHDSSMSEEQRDTLDLNARKQIREFDGRLKHLDKYEKLRQEKSQKGVFSSQKQLIGTINKHRDGILLSLSFELRNTSKLLLEMQNTRLSRKRNINTSDFDGLRNVDFKAKKYQPELVETSIEPELQQLSQDQLQVLQQESSEILDAKMEDLQKVDQILKSVTEIAQLESELASHLQVQSESIRTMVNDHDETELTLVDGNKILKKATGKGNWSTRMITYFAVFGGVTLLIANRLKP